MPKIVSIHSFRGGTGKSNITANVAAAIAQTGRRVGIVDTDIQSPGIHALFGFDESRIQHSLNDYLWGRCGIRETAYDVTSILKTNPLSKAKIFLIPSSLKVGEIARVLREGYSVDLLNQGFKELVESLKLDYLLIDTHPGINEETLLSIAISDQLLIILRPDRQDFQGTAVAVDIARKLHVPQLFLVVNRALVAYDFDALRDRIQATYNANVIGIIPNSDEVMQLASSDIFCLRFPNHSFSQEIMKISKHLISH